LPRFERTLGNPSGFFGINSPVTLIKMMASFAVMAWYYDQIVLLGNGQKNDPHPNPLQRLLALERREIKWIKARKAWLARAS
jgi:uncharacterized protein YdaL